MNIQPAVAVFLSWFGDLRHWASIDGLSVARTATGGRNQFRYPYAAICRVAINIGFQSILFLIFAKIYGEREGIVPPDSWFCSVLALFTVESGLIAGALLLLIGLSLGALRSFGGQPSDLALSRRCVW